MPLVEFWHEDTRLFECYQKAYRERRNNAAWLNGLYVFEAVSAAVNNMMPGAISTAFSKNGHVKPMEYHNAPIDLHKKKADTSGPKDGNDASGVAAWSERVKQMKGMK